MTILRRHILGVLAVSAVFAAAAPASAAPMDVVKAAPPAIAAVSVADFTRYAQNSISPSKAKAIAARRVPGAKFVDISRSGNKYRVRMLRKDGRVVDVLIDASTGRVLN